MQTTPLQAQILDWLYEQKSKLSDAPGDVSYAIVERQQVEMRFTLQASDYTLLVTDLERMSIIRPQLQTYGDAWQQPVYAKIRLTAFGLHLLEACARP